MGDEGPVEQKARDQKEDRHPDVEVREQTTRDRVRDRAAEDRGVEHHDEPGGNGTHCVEERKARVTGRRRDRLWNRRRHRLGIVEAPGAALRDH
jgi:hypothetical protein